MKITDAQACVTGRPEAGLRHCRKGAGCTCVQAQGVGGGMEYSLIKHEEEENNGNSVPF